MSLLQSTNSAEGVTLFTRLIERPPGGVVARFFRGHLATKTRDNILNLLRQRLAQPVR